VEGSPAKLENHGNAFLHYSDDWYILSSKPDQYVLIYYIGNNDAWQGYGGATVYTRSPPPHLLCAAMSSHKLVC